jgi:hypothetical protein
MDKRGGWLFDMYGIITDNSARETGGVSVDGLPLFGLGHRNCSSGGCEQRRHSTKLRTSESNARVSLT